MWNKDPNEQKEPTLRSVNCISQHTTANTIVLSPHCVESRTFLIPNKVIKKNDLRKIETELN